jgi:hypothetical protein
MRFDYGRAPVGFVVLAAIGAASALIGARISGAAPEHAPEIVRINSNAALTGTGKYPPDMVPGGQKSFDGSFKTAPGYVSGDSWSTCGRAAPVSSRPAAMLTTSTVWW